MEKQEIGELDLDDEFHGRVEIDLGVLYRRRWVCIFRSGQYKSPEMGGRKDSFYTGGVGPEGGEKRDDSKGGWRIVGGRRPGLRDVNG